jgi:hypothetical protein
MKLAALKPWTARQQRLERWRRDRAAAPTLRGGFPRVERVRIDLNFSDGASHAPAAQSHILHPAAQAYFTFPCPFADCNGRFDLDADVIALLKTSAHQCEGTHECAGNRVRGGKGEQPCQLQLHFSISAQYGRDSSATP